MADYEELLKFDTLAHSAAKSAKKFFETFRDTIIRPNQVLSGHHDYTKPLAFLAVGWLLTRAGTVLISAASPIQFGGTPTRLSQIGLGVGLQTPFAASAALLPLALATIFGAKLLSRIMRGSPTEDAAIAAACYPIPVYLTWLMLVYAVIIEMLTDIESRPDQSQQQAGIVLIVGVMVGLVWCIASVVRGMLRTAAPIQRRWKRWGRAATVTVLSVFLLQAVFLASQLADLVVGRPSPMFSVGSPVQFTPWLDPFLQSAPSERWQFRLHIDNQTGRPVALERDSCKAIGSEIHRFEITQWSAADAARVVIQPDERGWLDVDVVVGGRWSNLSDHGPQSLTLLCQMGQKKELYGLELVDFALAGSESRQWETP